MTDLSELERRMDSAIAVLGHSFAGLRGGRASPSLLDKIMVEVYQGQSIPLRQLGSISTPDARTITVLAWDQTTTKAIEKAIRDSGLGLNPQSDGRVIRVPTPELSHERRQELRKFAARRAELARVAIRNVRREGMEQLKEEEKRGDISQSQRKLGVDKVQTLTDARIKTVDAMLADKEKEILQV